MLRNTVSFAIEQLAAEGYLTLSPDAVRRWPQAWRWTAARSIAEQPFNGQADKLSAWARGLQRTDWPPIHHGGRGRSSRDWPMSASFRTICGAAVCAARRETRCCAGTGPSTIRRCSKPCCSIWRFIAASRPSRGQILIVPTAQSGLALVAGALLERGDHAWIESPGYGGAHVALRAAGAVVSAIPLDEQGMTSARARTRQN